MWKLSPLLLVGVLAGGCSDGCGDGVISAKTAPDARHSAVIFDRDCGATTGFSTQISVLDAGQRPTGAGNVFVADGNHGAAQAADWGGPWAEAVWRGPDRLLVRYDAKARVFQQNAAVAGVHVSFKPVARP